MCVCCMFKRGAACSSIFVVCSSVGVACLLWVRKRNRQYINIHVNVYIAKKKKKPNNKKWLCTGPGLLYALHICFCLPLAIEFDCHLDSFTAFYMHNLPYFHTKLCTRHSNYVAHIKFIDIFSLFLSHSFSVSFSMYESFIKRNYQLDLNIKSQCLQVWK